MHQNQQLTQYDRISSALSSINRPLFYHHHFNSWSSVLFNGGFVSTHFYYRSHTDQYFNSWFLSDLTEASPALIFTTGPIQINISTANSSEIKREPRQHSSLLSVHTGQIRTFFSWNNPPKITLYGDFRWFSYRRIFSPIFLHGLNFEFHFNSFYRWDE